MIQCFLIQKPIIIQHKSGPSLLNKAQIKSPSCSWTFREVSGASREKRGAAGKKSSSRTKLQSTSAIWRKHRELNWTYLLAPLAETVGKAAQPHYRHTRTSANGKPPRASTTSNVTTRTSLQNLHNLFFHQPSWFAITSATTYATYKFDIFDTISLQISK